jgi:hypothetical protein
MRRAIRRQAGRGTGTDASVGLHTRLGMAVGVDVPRTAVAGHIHPGFQQVGRYRGDRSRAVGARRVWVRHQQGGRLGLGLGCRVGFFHPLR